MPIVQETITGQRDPARYFTIKHYNQEASVTEHESHVEISMANTTLHLSILPNRFAICKLDRAETLPNWGMETWFYSMTCTHDTLSIVCPEDSVPAGTMCEKGWKAIRFEGVFEFELVGILNSVTVPLAEAQISIFALSTYDTDYVLVKESQLNMVMQVLSDCGHTIQQSTDHN